jgi:abortive infection bacteriophage resistance protein
MLKGRDIRNVCVERDNEVSIVLWSDIILEIYTYSNILYFYEKIDNIDTSKHSGDCVHHLL